MKAVLSIAAGVLSQLVLSTPFEPSLHARDDGDSCGTNLQVCNPPGASTTTLPALGPDLSGLYFSLLDSVKGISFEKRAQQHHHHHRRRRDNTPSFCCATGTSCLTLSNFSLPFCYDKFTTNFLFPDGSSGTIHTGSFAAADGATADLLAGTYTNGSTTGNLYSADPAAKPNTATLSIPPQYTASGVGSAIPLTALGTVVVITTTVSETVVGPTTISASTVRGTTVEGSTTRADSVVPGTTIAATSTVSAHETVMTVTSSAASATGSAAATGGVGRIGVGRAMVGVAGVFGWAVL